MILQSSDVYQYPSRVYRCNLCSVKSSKDIVDENTDLGM